MVSEMVSTVVKALVAFAMVSWQFASVPLHAQELMQPLPVEDLVSSLSLTDDAAALSPDGKWLAYTLEDPRRAEKFAHDDRPYTDFGSVGKSGLDIWVADTNSGSSSRVTEGQAASWGPVWSPDAHYLAFYSTRGGQPNIWVYDRESKRLRQVSDVIVRPLELQVVRWTSDGKRLLTKIAPEQSPAGDSAIMRPVADDQVVSSTVTVYRSGLQKDSGDNRSEIYVEDSRTKAEQADLALIDVDTGAVDRIARGFKPDWYEMSPDGSRLAFATWKGLRGGSRHRNSFDLLVVNAGEQPRIVATDIVRGGWGFSASWAPDGKWLSYVVLEDGYADGEPYIVSVAGEPPKKLAQQAHPALNNYSGRAPVWDEQGQELYFLSSYDSVWKVSLSDGRAREVAHMPGWRIWSIAVTSLGGRTGTVDRHYSMVVTCTDVTTGSYGFCGIDLNTGTVTELLKERKVYRINQLLYSASAESLVYLAEDVGHERDFWVVGADFKEPRQITHVNPRLSRYAMGPSRLIEWQDLDGKTIRGALLLPVGYKEGKRYPLIVNVYGGGGLSLNVNCFGLNPNSGYAPDNKQLFATRGFAVLSPDAPLAVGTPVRDLMKTVLPGVNKAIDLGIADPDRLGLMGVSYGGYSTLALIAQTTRFKAAMMTSGFGDLIGFSGEMEREGGSLGAALLRERWWTGGRMPGSVWESRQAYVENSPVFYLDRVQTPLLIVHGGSDTNVAPFLSDEIYVFLRSLGKEVVYAKYEGEGHATFVGYANQIDFCNRMIQWFESHLANSTGS
jgi:dipeptidyl aminopeptidase/acylaminoacyl peptidase